MKLLTRWVKPCTRYRVRRLMEDPTQKIQRQHYPHSDPFNHFRWTARECYQFMYDRDWGTINEFYADLVNGRSNLSELFGVQPCQNETNAYESFDEYAPEASPSEDKSSRWARVTFKIVVSYHGDHFDGWQKQPGLNSVQGLVERSVGTFVDDKKAQKLKDKGRPVEGMTVVAGRTDKGVTALNQVCSFYTWRKDVKLDDVEHAINIAAPGKLRVVSVSQVSRAFHPNFCAKWRRYLYIFPLARDKWTPNQTMAKANQLCDISHGGNRDENDEANRIEKIDDISEDEDVIDGMKKPTSFCVARVDQLLRQLEGKLLSYKMFARDTKASRNIGPPTECFLYHARAAEARLPCSNKQDEDCGAQVMCIELVANRFLRRMVRVLVATVVREAAAGSEDDVLLRLIEASCRRATAPPAPPDGLCLVDVGYSDFNPGKCFIP